MVRIEFDAGWGGGFHWSFQTLLPIVECGAVLCLSQSYRVAFAFSGLNLNYRQAYNCVKMGFCFKYLYCYLPQMCFQVPPLLQDLSLCFPFYIVIKFKVYLNFCVLICFNQYPFESIFLYFYFYFIVIFISNKSRICDERFWIQVHS